MLKESYEASGDWPDDATEISNEHYQSLMNRKDASMDVFPSEDGYPELRVRDVDWQSTAYTTKERLISEADKVTAGWVVDLQLGTLSDDDRASLIKWRAYNKALNNIILDNVIDEQSFTAIAWPEKP